MLLGGISIRDKTGAALKYMDQLVVQKLRFLPAVRVFASFLANFKGEAFMEVQVLLPLQG